MTVLVKVIRVAGFWRRLFWWISKEAYGKTSGHWLQVKHDGSDLL
jgi:hypothetical protein